MFRCFFSADKRATEQFETPDRVAAIAASAAALAPVEIDRADRLREGPAEVHPVQEEEKECNGAYPRLGIHPRTNAPKKRTRQSTGEGGAAIFFFSLLYFIPFFRYLKVTILKRGRRKGIKGEKESYKSFM